MDRRQDPRTIVTPYAFSVHPDLLGRPLATPWQRLAAIGVDLIVISLLSQIGAGTLAIASGLLLFWLAIRKPGRDVFGKLFRFAVGCLGVVVLVLALVVWWGLRFAQELEENPERAAELIERVTEAAGSAGVNLDVDIEGATGGPDSLALGEFLRLAPDLLSLRGADDAAEARTIALRAATTARAGGMSLGELRDVLTALMPEDAPWSDQAQDIVDEVMTELRTGVPVQEQAQEDPGGMQEEARANITDTLALDSIAALNDLVENLVEEREDAEDQLTRTRARLEEAESQGVLDWLWNLIDDLGLGFGWGALYLTITHAWWKGTSIGKKLLRIRVVMIDKRPLNWWLSFERAGGYAAGFATGLLGFAQIFWDPNRQAIHDKVSETIVIQDGKKPVPGPWIAEGQAQWERARSSSPPRPPSRS